MAKLMWVFLSIIVFVQLQADTDHCYPRKYPTGGAKITKENLPKNTKICRAIVDPIKCAKDNEKICIWAKDGEIFEGPTVKSISFFDASIMADDVWEKEWENKGNDESSESEKAEKLKNTKKSPSIATWDGDVVYTYEYTDWSAHEKIMEEVIAGLDPKIRADLSATFKTVSSKEATSETPPKLRVKTKPEEAHLHSKAAKVKPLRGSRDRSPEIRTGGRRLIERKGLIERRSLIARRRRLLPTPVADRTIHAYPSVGLLRVGPRGAATGTIIWIGKDRRNHPEFIYVLAAAHDIWQRHRLYRTIDLYSFWPGFHGTEQQRLDRVANADHLYFRQYNVGRMVRSWMISDWDLALDDPSMNAYDVAILKFEVDPEFVVGKATVRGNTRFPETDHPAPPNREMVMYDVGDVTQRVAANRNYHMDHQDVPIYCPNHGDYCRYDGVPIKGGYCGGPVLNAANEIIAIQVSKSAINPDAHDAYNTGCETAARFGYANCRGNAARISGTKIRAFRWIAIQHRVPAGWNVVHHRAHMGYDEYSHWVDDDYEYNDDGGDYTMDKHMDHDSQPDSDRAHTMLYAVIALSFVAMCVMMWCTCCAAGANIFVSLSNMNAKDIHLYQLDQQSAES